MTLKSHHTKTVLVVDDEPAIRMMIYRILTGQGYHVLEAGDGLAALDVLRGPHRVDLLLTDLIMPRMGGAELVVESNKLVPDLKVICISGKIPMDSGPFSRLAEAFDVKSCLEKPFEPAALIAKVRASIGHPTNTVEL